MRQPDPAGRPPDDGCREPTASALSRRRGLSPTQKRSPRAETRAQRVSVRRKRLCVAQNPRDDHRTTDAASPRHPQRSVVGGTSPHAETRSPRRNTSTTRFPAQEAFMRQPNPPGRPPDDGFRKPTASATLSRRRDVSPRRNAIPTQKHEHNAFPCAGSVYASSPRDGHRATDTASPRHPRSVVAGASLPRKNTTRAQKHEHNAFPRAGSVYASAGPRGTTTGRRIPRAHGIRNAQSSPGPLPHAETRSPRRNTSTTRFRAQEAFMRQPDPAGRPPDDGCRKPTASSPLSPRRGRRGRRCAWRGRRR